MSAHEEGKVNFSKRNQDEAPEQSGASSVVNFERTAKRPTTKEIPLFAFVPRIGVKTGELNYDMHTGDILTAPKESVFVQCAADMLDYLSTLFPSPPGTTRIRKLNWQDTNFGVCPEGVLILRDSHTYCAPSDETVKFIVDLCKQGWKISGAGIDDKPLWKHGVIRKGEFTVYDLKAAQTKLRRLASYDKSKHKRGADISANAIHELQYRMRNWVLKLHPMFKQVNFNDPWEGFTCGDTIETYMEYTIRLSKAAEWVWRRPIWRTDRKFRARMLYMVKGLPNLPRRGVYSGAFTLKTMHKHPAIKYCKWFIKEFGAMFPKEKEKLRYMRSTFRKSVKWMRAKITKEGECILKNSSAAT